MSNLSIAVINTGGTISCTGNPLAPMSAQAFATASQQILNPILLQQFPGLSVTYITDLPFPESSSQTLDSTNLQPTDWCLIASYILSHYAQYDGWVVLHGTDSMDFTGTALPFLLSVFSADGYPQAALSKPIIITGSQVPMFYQDPKTQDLSLNYNTDAFQNFCGAIAAAQTGIAEVCVYFNDKLMRGNRVSKTNASEFDAFSSPNYPLLGEYGITLSVVQDNILPPPVSQAISLDNPEVCSAAIAQLAYLQANINSYPVMQFNAFPAWYQFNDANQTCSGLLATLIDAVVAAGIKGLILESYGEGNFPSGNPDNPAGGATYQALLAANKAGVAIVNCTQVLSGVVNDSAYAAGAWLPAVGALSPADMTPMAALAKLMILLTAAGYHGWSTATVATLMQLNLLGEMLSVSRLDSRSNATLLPGQTLTALDGSATLRNDAELGPVLTSTVNSQTTVLWQALASPDPATLPGRLVMQNDGNLVFYSRANTALWATNTGVSSGASSTLGLSGSAAASPSTLSLTVFDYSRGVTTSTLFAAPAAQPGSAAIKQPKPAPPSRPAKTFKLSGMISPADRLHQFTVAGTLGDAPDEHYIAPVTVNVSIVQPPGIGVIGVPQYSPTINGGIPTAFAPATDCDGNFMSAKFQPNNNCYAYGCNLTTNTFPQPGKRSGYLLTAANFQQPFAAIGELVAGYATRDGLVLVGRSPEDLVKFREARSAAGGGGLDGHYVALMISPAGDADWPGDYHWARCDNSSGPCDSWSQKDGNDQVTNFDFAGNPITNPATANWTVNQGPLADSKSPDNNQDQIVTYAFYCFMFVPASGVNII